MIPSNIVFDREPRLRQDFGIAHQARGAVARRGIRGTRLDPEAEQLGVDARQQQAIAVSLG